MHEHILGRVDTLIAVVYENVIFPLRIPRGFDCPIRWIRSCLVLHSVRSDGIILAWVLRVGRGSGVGFCRWQFSCP